MLDIFAERSITIMVLAIACSLVSYEFEVHHQALAMVMALLVVVYGFHVHPIIGLLAILLVSLILSLVYVASTRITCAIILFQTFLVAYTNYGWYGFWATLAAYRVWLHDAMQVLWTFSEFCVFSFFRLIIHRKLEDIQVKDSPDWSKFVKLPSNLDWITPLRHGSQWLYLAVVPGWKVAIPAILRVTAEVLTTVAWLLFRNWFSGQRYLDWRPYWIVERDRLDHIEYLRKQKEHRATGEAALEQLRAAEERRKREWEEAERERLESEMMAPFYKREHELAEKRRELENRQIVYHDPREFEDPNWIRFDPQIGLNAFLGTLGNAYTSSHAPKLNPEPVQVQVDQQPQPAQSQAYQAPAQVQAQVNQDPAPAQVPVHQATEQVQAQVNQEQQQYQAPQPAQVPVHQAPEQVQAQVNQEQQQYQAPQPAQVPVHQAPEQVQAQVNQEQQQYQAPQPAQVPAYQAPEQAQVQVPQAPLGYQAPELAQAQVNQEQQQCQAQAQAQAQVQMHQANQQFHAQQQAQAQMYQANQQFHAQQQAQAQVNQAPEQFHAQQQAQAQMYQAAQQFHAQQQAQAQAQMGQAQQYNGQQQFQAQVQAYQAHQAQASQSAQAVDNQFAFGSGQECQPPTHLPVEMDVENVEEKKPDTKPVNGRNEAQAAAPARPVHNGPVPAMQTATVAFQVFPRRQQTQACTRTRPAQATAAPVRQTYNRNRGMSPANVNPAAAYRNPETYNDESDDEGPVETYDPDKFDPDNVDMAGRTAAHDSMLRAEKVASPVVDPNPDDGDENLGTTDHERIVSVCHKVSGLLSSVSAHGNKEDLRRSLTNVTSLLNNLANKDKERDRVESLVHDVSSLVSNLSIQDEEEEARLRLLAEYASDAFHKMSVDGREEALDSLFGNISAVVSNYSTYMEEDGNEEENDADSIFGDVEIPDAPEEHALPPALVPGDVEKEENDVDSIYGDVEISDAPEENALPPALVPGDVEIPDAPEEHALPPALVPDTQTTVHGHQSPAYSQQAPGSPDSGSVSSGVDSHFTDLFSLDELDHWPEALGQTIANGNQSPTYSHRDPDSPDFASIFAGVDANLSDSESCSDLEEMYPLPPALTQTTAHGSQSPVRAEHARASPAPASPAHHMGFVPQEASGNVQPTTATAQEDVDDGSSVSSVKFVPVWPTPLKIDVEEEEDPPSPIRPVTTTSIGTAPVMAASPIMPSIEVPSRASSSPKHYGIVQSTEDPLDFGSSQLSEPDFQSTPAVPPAKKVRLSPPPGGSPLPIAVPAPTSAAETPFVFKPFAPATLAADNPFAFKPSDPATSSPTDPASFKTGSRAPGGFSFSFSRPQAAPAYPADAPPTKLEVIFVPATPSPRGSVISDEDESEVNQAVVQPTEGEKGKQVANEEEAVDDDGESISSADWERQLEEQFLSLYTEEEREQERQAMGIGHIPVPMPRVEYKYERPVFYTAENNPRPVRPMHRRLK